MSTIYPYPNPAIDSAAIDSALQKIRDDDTADDATVAALETLLKSKDVAIDQAIAALETKVNAIPTTVVAPKAEIDPIFDPLSPPQPIVAVQALTGATVVSGATGSAMVNGGKVHSFARLSSPPAPNSWNGTLTISPVTGACKIRFGITSAIQGTIEVSIDGATPLTASNTGLGWSSVTPEIAVFADNGFNWFEVAIAQSGSPQSVKVTIPTGRGLLPCVYAPDAITSLIPPNPTGLTLRSMPGGAELSYRPAQLALKSELPTPYNPTALTDRVTALETRSQQTFTRVADPKWFDTPFSTRYLRKVSKASITSLTLEYKQANGTIRAISLTDFTTGFSNSGFWNGASDPNGLTRFIADAETVVVSWDGTGENLTLSVQTKASVALQIRKVYVNGVALDWLAAYDPSSSIDSIAANAAAIAAKVDKPAHGYTAVSWYNNANAEASLAANTDFAFNAFWSDTNPNGLTNTELISTVRGRIPYTGLAELQIKVYRQPVSSRGDVTLRIYDGTTNTVKRDWTSLLITNTADMLYSSVTVRYNVTAGDTIVMRANQAAKYWNGQNSSEILLRYV